MTAELRLLVCSTRIITSADGQAAMRHILADGVNWTRFARKAVDYGLAGLAGHKLAATASDLMPDDILDALRMTLDQTRTTNVALLNELADVTELFAKESIAAIPLGGPSLAKRAYGDTSFRACRDLDLAVRDG